MWISSTALDSILDVALEVLGPEALRDFYAQSVNGWSDSKLFGPLFGAARRIFGSNPAGHLKWIDRAWQITTRNMGVVSTTETQTGVQVVHADLPPTHRVERVIHSTYGSIDGLVRGQGEVPTIIIDDSRLAEGFVIFDVSW